MVRSVVGLLGGLVGLISVMGFTLIVRIALKTAPTPVVAVAGGWQVWLASACLFGGACYLAAHTAN